jgi:hypothetical protein
MTISIKERLKNPQVFRGYCQMIRTSDIDVVKDLRKNIKAQAEGHSKQIELEVLFKERLGE